MRSWLRMVGAAAVLASAAMSTNPATGESLGPTSPRAVAEAKPAASPASDLAVWSGVSAAKGSNVGYADACGLQRDGSLWCWGANDRGQLGLGDTKNRYRPFRVGQDSDWASVSTGSGNTCALKTDHTLWCWGWGWDSVPTEVGDSTSWASISNGSAFWCGTQLDGTLWCWGDNAGGELGLGDYQDRSSPTQVGSGADWSLVSADGYHTCGLWTDGTLWCWGTSLDGALGLGEDVLTVNVPTQVGTGVDWTGVSEGAYFSCRWQADHTAWCWGNNDEGELGTGGRHYTYAPTEVGTSTHWRSVTAGTYHTCGERLNGTLWCWGDNGFGQLGVGEAGGNHTTPTRVGRLSSWAAYSPGGSATCSTRTDNTLWCWGNPKGGQVGVGDRTLRTDAPVQVGLPNIAVPVSRVYTGVSADSASDVWVVGHRQKKHVSQVLVTHFDGSSWSRVPAPDPSKRMAEFAAVQALGPSDVWAVGTYGGGDNTHTLTEHWDGSARTLVPSPDATSRLNQLVSVDAVSAHDVWAAGYGEPTYDYPQALVEHWDGTSWQVVPTPPLPK